jgi:hypothetical protein
MGLPTVLRRAMAVALCSALTGQAVTPPAIPAVRPSPADAFATEAVPPGLMEFVPSFSFRPAWHCAQAAGSALRRSLGQAFRPAASVVLGGFAAAQSLLPLTLTTGIKAARGIRPAPADVPGSELLIQLQSGDTLSKVALDLMPRLGYHGAAKHQQLMDAIVQGTNHAANAFVHPITNPDQIQAGAYLVVPDSLPGVRALVETMHVPVFEMYVPVPVSVPETVAPPAEFTMHVEVPIAKGSPHEFLQALGAGLSDHPLWIAALVGYAGLVYFLWRNRHRSLWARFGLLALLGGAATLIASHAGAGAILTILPVMALAAGSLPRPRQQDKPAGDDDQQMRKAVRALRDQRQQFADARVSLSNEEFNEFLDGSPDVGRVTAFLEGLIERARSTGADHTPLYAYYKLPRRHPKEDDSAFHRRVSILAGLAVLELSRERFLKHSQKLTTSLPALNAFLDGTAYWNAGAAIQVQNAINRLLRRWDRTGSYIFPGFEEPEAVEPPLQSCRQRPSRSRPRSRSGPRPRPRNCPWALWSSKGSGCRPIRFRAPSWSLESANPWVGLRARFWTSLAISCSTRGRLTVGDILLGSSPLFCKRPSRRTARRSGATRF